MHDSTRNKQAMIIWFISMGSDDNNQKEYVPDFWHKKELEPRTKPSDTFHEIRDSYNVNHPQINWEGNFIHNKNPPQQPQLGAPFFIALLPSLKLTYAPEICGFGK